MKYEFNDELIDCKNKASPYLTEFSPVNGFHVLCIYHYELYHEILVIGYMHGYKLSVLPNMFYKDRSKCRIRNIKDVGVFIDKYGNIKEMNINNYNNINLDNITDYYYYTNECQYFKKNKILNPKYMLFTSKSMIEMRKHLQIHFINDVGNYDEYTIFGQDISKSFDYTSNQDTIDIDDDINMESELCEELYTHKFLQKLVRKRRHKSNRYKKIYPLYHKNGFNLFYPNGRTLHGYFNVYKNSNYLRKLNKLYKYHNKVVFMFEGGNYIWPGIKKGHTITLDMGSQIQLKTLNMRPLIFEISGLITNGDINELINKSIPFLKKSQVGLNIEQKESDSRTCLSAWLFSNDNIIVDSLKTRISKITNIPKTFGEDIEILRYNASNKYDMHYDAFQTNDASSIESQKLLHAGFKNRIATIFYYFNNVSRGGHTVFPRNDYNYEYKNELKRVGNEQQIFLNKCNIKKNKYNELINDINTTLSIKPEKGKVILFYNMLPNGELDALSLHGGCMVINGVKWAANHWIWNRPFAL